MKLGIKGHETRGDEIIKILEMLGGKNRHEMIGGIYDKYFYYIDDEYKDISYSYIGPDEIKGYKIFSLEDFLEKYPYKVGDKVNIYIQNDDIEGWFDLEVAEITSMRWDPTRCRIVYKMKDINREFCVEDIKGKVDDNLFHTTNEYEEIVENSFQGGYGKCKLDIQSNGYELPEGYHFTDENGNVIDAKKILLVKNAPSYPKSYDECCDVLSMCYATDYKLKYLTHEHGYYECATSDKLCSLQDKLNILGKLIICRNAYWKIAGEELGLDKPWEPEWNWREYKFCIGTIHDEIEKFHAGNQNCILAFPTEEMQEVFYNNFKNLIETCKELL